MAEKVRIVRTGRFQPVRLIVVAAVCLSLVASAGCVRRAPAPAGSGATSASGARSGSSSAPAGTPESVSSELSRIYQQKLTWRDCRDQMRCATLTVPLDWSKPQGQTITLAVAQYPATGTDRLGALVMNPGGPGISGIQTLAEGKRIFANANRRYDIVTWDTRGTGDSSPITCLPNSALDAFNAIDSTPDNAAETKKLLASIDAYAAACVKNTGELIRHLDTGSTIKDMDVLRAALGESKLNYLGYSYGTFLGALYAQQFGKAVGRMVLDAPMDPALTSEQFIAGQAQGFSGAVQAYVDDCIANALLCPLAKSRTKAYQQLSQLSQDIDARPLPTDDPRRPLTQSLFHTAIMQGMYSKQLWLSVTLGLREALQQGRGATLLRLADFYNRRDAGGQYDIALQATGAIYCLDHPSTSSPADLSQQAARYAAAHPPFGELFAWSSISCARWPIKPAVQPQRFSAPDAPPILVIGATGDPATPYPWAKSLAGQLPGAVLLTRVGQGHTSYGQSNSCINQATDTYLEQGTLPAPNTKCSDK